MTISETVVALSVGLLRLSLMYARGHEDVVSSRTAGFFNALRRQVEQYASSPHFPGRQVRDHALALLHVPLCNAVTRVLESGEERDRALSHFVGSHGAWLSLNDRDKRQFVELFVAAKLPTKNETDADLAEWGWRFLGRLMDCRPETVRKRADEVVRSSLRMPIHRGGPIDLEFFKLSPASMSLLLRELMGEGHNDVNIYAIAERLVRDVHPGERRWKQIVERALPAVRAEDARAVKYSAGVEYRRKKKARAKKTRRERGS